MYKREHQLRSLCKTEFHNTASATQALITQPIQNQAPFTPFTEHPLLSLCKKNHPLLSLYKI